MRHLGPLMVLVGLGPAPVLYAAAEPPGCLLRGQRLPGDLARVEVTVECGGQLQAGSDAKAKPIKLDLNAKLVYDEKVLADGPGASGRAVRHYHTAQATFKLGAETMKPALRPERRLIVLRVEAPRVDLFSPAGPLLREELDLLLNVPGNSLLAERLLPGRRVAVGESWKHPAALMGAWLGLEKVSKAETQSNLLSVANGVARMQISGRVEGSQGGARSEIEIKGKYQFDLQAGRINWIGLLVKQHQQPGEVEAGFDTVIRLEMRIGPVAASSNLSEAALSGRKLDPDEDRLRLEHRAADGCWTLLHARQWYLDLDERDLTRLRLVLGGRRIAQCNVSSLPRIKPEKRPTLAQFQDDVRQSLGKNFGEFVEAGEATTSAKYHVHRVVLRGTVSEVPIEWIYHLVVGPQGHQAVMAFTVEQSLAERLEGADRRLVDSLRFVEGKTKP